MINKPWRTISGDIAPRVGLVLSGGGARGAYEVGVIEGIVAVLGLEPRDRPPFSIFCGTSVGAVNCAFLAGNTQRGDLNIAALRDVWRSMTIQDNVRISPRNLWRPQTGPPPADGAYGPQLLDTSALSTLITDAIDWSMLRSNISANRTHALVVAALDVADGVTTLFAETAPQVQFNVSFDPTRRAVRGPIGPEHVLASAAIPFLFPGRRVGGRHFVDGGLRFNTPIAPALRCGADKLVVISLLHETSPVHNTTSTTYPNIAFLAGKMLNALLLDPISYDLQILARINGLVEVLQEVLNHDELTRVEEQTRLTRGAAYRKVDTLVLRPSADIGRISGQHLRRLRGDGAFSWMVSKVLDRMDDGGQDWETDWASFLLFDGVYAEALMQMGRDDVMARSDEVSAFYA